MLEISVAILTDQEHKQSASDELAEELTSLCQEWGRIRAENASCRSFKSYCSDASASLKYIDCAFVVGVDHTGCAHGSKNLSDHVDWKFPPREFAVHAIRECDGGVEVSSGDTTGIDTKHDSWTVVSITSKSTDFSDCLPSPQQNEIDM
jgi:hypothetical protein